MSLLHDDGGGFLFGEKNEDHKPDETHEKGGQNFLGEIEEYLFLID